MTDPVISSNPNLPADAPVPVPEGADPLESVTTVKKFFKDVTIATVRVFLNKYMDEVDEVPEQVEVTGQKAEERDGEICWDICERRTDIFATQHKRRYQWTELVVINTTLKSYYDWVNSWAAGAGSAGLTVAGAASTAAA